MSKNNMTKSVVRRRLAEAGVKIAKVYIFGDSHLTPGQAVKLQNMRLQILKIVDQLK